MQRSSRRRPVLLELDPVVVRKARTLAKRAGRPVVRLARTHNHRFGRAGRAPPRRVTGADPERIPWVNRLVDAVRDDVGLEYGVALPVWHALRSGDYSDLTELAQKAAAGSVRVRVLKDVMPTARPEPPAVPSQLESHASTAAAVIEKP